MNKLEAKDSGWSKDDVIEHVRKKMYTELVNPPAKTNEDSNEDNKSDEIADGEENDNDNEFTRIQVTDVFTEASNNYDTEVVETSEDNDKKIVMVTRMILTVELQPKVLMMMY